MLLDTLLISSPSKRCWYDAANGVWRWQSLLRIIDQPSEINFETADLLSTLFDNNLIAIR